MSIQKNPMTQSTLCPEAEDFSETIPAKEATFICTTPEDDEELDFSEIHCCFCGRKLDKYHANSPWPITEKNYGEDGRTFCCDNCNKEYVWLARILDGRGQANLIATLRRVCGLA